MTEDNKEHSSFAVAITPEFNDKGEWTGSVSAVLEEDVRDDLSPKDLTQIRSVCGMMAACLPLMEEDEEFMVLVRDYFLENYQVLVDDINEEEGEATAKVDRPNFTRSIDGKVITLDFSTKTFGSA